MALRQELSPPLVLDPIQPHSHTVIFLHRFPESTTDQEVRHKVLSEKLTRNHKTLREQFPTLRWVFPYCKAHARPWNNLSPRDRVAVGMTLGSLSYITQVILHEANRVGGLHHIILGGQGEAAEAAHEAMSSFPKAGESFYSVIAPSAPSQGLSSSQPHDPEAAAQLRLAAFVGMHTHEGQMTRDVKTFAMASKAVPGQKRDINASILLNTPHKFIHGGYKLQTATWDGKRIDDFAQFLVDIGIVRTAQAEQKEGAGNEVLTPKERPDAKGDVNDGKEELTDMQKHALEIREQKKKDAELRQKVLQRIEVDRLERKMRQERDRQRRLQAAAEDPSARPTGSVNLLGTNNPRPASAATYDLYAGQGSRDNDDNGAECWSPDGVDDGWRRPPRKNRERLRHGRPLGGDSDSDPRDRGRGYMSEARLAALGLSLKIKEEEEEEDDDDDDDDDNVL